MAIAVLAYLLYVVDPEQIVASARAANGWYVLAFLALFPLNFLLETLQWRIMARAVLPGMSLRAAAASLLCGHSAGIVTPARVGDLVARAWYFPNRFVWQLGSAAFVHRLYDMAVIIGVGLVSTFFFFYRDIIPVPDVWSGFWVVGLALALILVTGLLWPPLAYRVLHRILPKRFGRRLQFLQELSLPVAVSSFMLALSRFCVFITQFVLLIFAFSAAGDFLVAFLGATLVFLLKIFVPPLTFLDLGIREGLSVYIFGLLGYPEAAAFNAAFLLFSINLLLPAGIGTPFLLRMQTRRDVSTKNITS